MLVRGVGVGLEGGCDVRCILRRGNEIIGFHHHHHHGRAYGILVEDMKEVIQRCRLGGGGFLS